MVQRIFIQVGDEVGAKREAMDLLQNAVTLDDDGGGGSSLGYKARWTGSPAALGALSLHRDAVVNVNDVARALQGLDARHGQRMRKAGANSEHELVVASYDLVLPAPSAVTREWLHGTPERRLEIERAMAVSAEEMLEHLRRTSELVVRRVDDKRLPELAHGIAAAVIIDAPSEREPGDEAELRVHALIVGVERSDGEVVTPSLGPILKAEAELDVEGLVVLASELAPTQRQSPPMVGRDGVWVADPFNELRESLGPYAERVDDRATLYGEIFADRDDALLERQLAEIGSPFDRFDRERGAASLQAINEQRAAEERLFRAQEDFEVLEGRSRDHDDRRTATAHALETTRARRRVLNRARMEAYANDNHYLRDWIAGNETAAEEWVAIKRELAIREQEAAQRELGAAAPAPTRPPANARTIGRGEVADILAELRTERHEWREASALPGAARRVDRDDIELPHPLDGVRDVLGDVRTDRLVHRTESVGRWVASQPDEWLRARHAELGDPLKWLDLGGARELLRIERDIVIAADELQRWRDQLPRDLVSVNHIKTDRGLVLLEAVDPRYEVECRQVNRQVEKVADLTQRVNDLKAERRHPGRWMADSDRAVRALAYATEVQIRREVGWHQEVERSLVDPPGHIVDLIGPRPDRDAPERGDWDTVTRNIEHRRLALEAGADQSEVRAPLPDLDQRVDQLREAADMPALDRDVATGRELER